MSSSEEASEVTFTPDLTQNETMVLVILYKITATLSMICSLYIVWSMLYSKFTFGGPASASNQLKNMHNRLLFALSFCDVLSSFGIALGTWPMPKDSDSMDFYSSWYEPAGNWATCEAQGFITHFGFQSSGVYNVWIGLYFVLFIKYNWTENDFKRIEVWLHAAALLPSLLVCIAAVINDVFNPAIILCWISAYPHECLDRSDVECERGEKVLAFVFVGFFMPVLVCLLATIVLFVMLYRHVSKVEHNAQRWMEIYGIDSSRKYASRVLKLSTIYVAAYFSIWSPSFINLIFSRIGNSFNFPVMILTGFMMPSQGILNLFIYTKFVNSDRQLTSNTNTNKKTSSPCPCIVEFWTDWILQGCKRPTDILTDEEADGVSSVSEDTVTKPNRLQVKEEDNGDDSACFDVSMNIFQFLES